MKCIDCIEGTVKFIIAGLHQLSVEDRLDDTEYIRTIKTVIDATDRFMQDNKEISNEPQILKNVLYSFSKKLWLNQLEKNPHQERISNNKEYSDEDDGYYDYYYNYIYNHGVYPS